MDRFVSKRGTRLIVALCAALLVSCATPAEDVPPPPESVISDGRAIAEAECASCHAVGPYGESPNAAAPVFRNVLARYRAGALEEDLIAGIRVAHPMPHFQFNPQGAEALVAYMQSIQQPPADQRSSDVSPAALNIEQGRRIAEINCSTCHAIGLNGESRHPMAPPFRTLSQAYPLNSLEEAFAEGVLVGHPEMPEFQLQPEQIDQLLAYLNSVQLRRGG